MAPRRSLFSQSLYLYDVEWTEEIDKYFIGLLVEQRKLGNYTVEGDNHVTFEVLRWIINNEFDVDFSPEETYAKVRALKKRHAVFDWLIHRSGVHWDSNNNVITVDAFVWNQLCEEEPFVYAYVTKGDPNWFELEKIFGEDISVEGDDEGDFWNGIPFIDLESPPYDDVVDLSSDDFEYGDYDLGAAGNGAAANTPLVILSSGGNSPDNSFWNDLANGYATDTLSESIYPRGDESSVDNYTSSPDEIERSSSASNNPTP